MAMIWLFILQKPSIRFPSLFGAIPVNRTLHIICEDPRNTQRTESMLRAEYSSNYLVIRLSLAHKRAAGRPRIAHAITLLHRAPNQSYRSEPALGARQASRTGEPPGRKLATSFSRGCTYLLHGPFLVNRLSGGVVPARLQHSSSTAPEHEHTASVLRQSGRTAA